MCDDLKNALQTLQLLSQTRNLSRRGQHNEEEACTPSIPTTKAFPLVNEDMPVKILVRVTLQFASAQTDQNKESKNFGSFEAFPFSHSLRKLRVQSFSERRCVSVQVSMRNQKSPGTCSKSVH